MLPLLPPAPRSCFLRPGHARRPPQHASSPRPLPSPSPATKCYTLSITGRHQSTPAAYTPDYCRYRFLNRKIYTLNITVNTGKSIGMSELLLLLGLKAPSRRTVYTCSLNALGNLARFNGRGHKINDFAIITSCVVSSAISRQPCCQEMCAAQ